MSARGRCNRLLSWRARTASYSATLGPALALEAASKTSVGLAGTGRLHLSRIKLSFMEFAFESSGFIF
jgi:hypothetical protein